MSGAPAPGQDPSMEEILASIRKILNEEDAPAAAPPPEPPPPEPALPGAPPRPQVPEPDPAPEPLELTEAMIVPGPRVPAATIETSPLPAAAPPVPPPAPVAVAEPVIPPVPVPALPDDPAEGIVAPATAAATAALIGQLARTVAAERAAPVHRGGPSIEDVVREEVRPLLKAWMDAHLPAMVERLVRAEIERVVNRSLG